MAQSIQFDASQHGRSPLCIVCEEMIPDAADQILSPADQAWFDQHIAACVDCNHRLADAQRGAALLELLKSPRPEPSADLLDRILAQTSGQASDFQQDNLPALIGQPVAARGTLLAFRPRMPRLNAWASAYSQPRLAMTAAMAFFSIALTLNLTGVRLDQLHASSFTPSGIRRTYYQASADAVRYYDNLRVVRVLESRVDDLRQATGEDHATPAPQQDTTPKPAPKPANSPNGPQSRRETPIPGLRSPDDKLSSHPSSASLKNLPQEGGPA